MRVDQLRDHLSGIFTAPTVSRTPVFRLKKKKTLENLFTFPASSAQTGLDPGKKNFVFR